MGRPEPEAAHPQEAQVPRQRGDRPCEVRSGPVSPRRERGPGLGCSSSVGPRRRVAGCDLSPVLLIGTLSSFHGLKLNRETNRRLPSPDTAGNAMAASTLRADQARTHKRIHSSRCPWAQGEVHPVSCWRARPLSGVSVSCTCSGGGRAHRPPLCSPERSVAGGLGPGEAAPTLRLWPLPWSLVSSRNQ